jgi:hypothetical protein
MKTRLAVASVLTLLAVSTAPTLTLARPPTLDSIFPAGGRRGETVQVKATGSFERWPIGVATAHDSPGIEVTALPEKGSLSIRVAADARVGVHWFRLHDEEGATALRPFLVGTLPEVTEVEPNDDPLKPQAIPAAGVTVNGKLGRNGDVDGFAVTLKKGQTLVAAIEANRRLGSPMDGLLEVLNADGFVLGQNDDGPDRDPLLVFEAPADATYIVRVFAFPAEPDQRIGFSGGDLYCYRLTLTTGGFLDHVYPLSVAGDGESHVEAVGWNIDESTRALRVPVEAGAGPSERITVDHPRLANSGEVRIEAHRVSVEVEPNPKDHPQDLSVPATVSGRIEPARDRDAYQFAARKGESWSIRVESRSLGQPLDPTLRVLDASNKVLAEMDDPGGGRRRSTGRDPELTFSVPADGQYRIIVGDVNDEGSFRHAYRLTVSKPDADFRVTLAADRFALKPGTPLKIPVTVERDNGFDRPIEVNAAGLPDGVSAAGVTSAPTGSSAKSVTLELTSTGGPWSGPIGIVGRVAGGGDLLPRSKTATATLAGPNSATDRIWLTVLKPAAPKPEEKKK